VREQVLEILDQHAGSQVSRLDVVYQVQRAKAGLARTDAELASLVRVAGAVRVIDIATPMRDGRNAMRQWLGALSPASA
jgi:hypothetical protein